MTASISGVSSMATRLILEELSQAFAASAGVTVNIRAMGGVDAAKVVREGEAVDIVVLADTALAKLEADGFIAPGSVRGFTRSGMAIAAPAGRTAPDIGSEAAVRAAVLAADRVAYSTGPSGDHLLKLCEGWNVPADRLVKAPPGVPVGSLVAKGEADLGFQQLSELIHVEGIDVLGPLPPAIQSITVFAAGIGAKAADPARVEAFIAYLASDAVAETKRKQGMEPA